jgi:hypothetical protein
MNGTVHRRKTVTQQYVVTIKNTEYTTERKQLQVRKPFVK